MSAVSGAQGPSFESPFVGFDRVEDIPQIHEQIERIFAALFTPPGIERAPCENGQGQQDLSSTDLAEEYHVTRAGAIRSHYLPDLPQDAQQYVDSLMAGCLGTSDMLRIAARYIELSSFLVAEEEELSDNILNITQLTATSMRETIGPAVRTLSKLTTDDMLGPIFQACAHGHRIPSQFMPPEDEYSRSFCKGPANSFLAMDAVMNIFQTYDYSSASFIESLRLRRDTLGDTFSLLQSGHDLALLLHDLPNLDESARQQLTAITPHYFQEAAQACQNAVVVINQTLPVYHQDQADNLEARFLAHSKRPDSGWSRFL